MAQFTASTTLRNSTIAAIAGALCRPLMQAEPVAVERLGKTPSPLRRAGHPLCELDEVVLQDREIVADYLD